MSRSPLNTDRLSPGAQRHEAVCSPPAYRQPTAGRAQRQRAWVSALGSPLSPGFASDPAALSSLDASLTPYLVAGSAFGGLCADPRQGHPVLCTVSQRGVCAVPRWCMSLVSSSYLLALKPARSDITLTHAADFRVVMAHRTTRTPSRSVESGCSNVTKRGLGSRSAYIANCAPSSLRASLFSAVKWRQR